MAAKSEAATEIAAKFAALCARPSDINEHLPTLREYAQQVDSIVEMGVRGVVSTWALLSGLTSGSGGSKTLVGVDIERCAYDGPAQAGRALGVDVRFVQGDSALVDAPARDLLFIGPVFRSAWLAASARIDGCVSGWRLRVPCLALALTGYSRTRRCASRSDCSSSDAFACPLRPRSPFRPAIFPPDLRPQTLGTSTAISSASSRATTQRRASGSCCTTRRSTPTSASLSAAGGTFRSKCG